MDRRDQARPRTQGSRAEREAAMTAGTAIHRVLEELDLSLLAQNPGEALGRERGRLPEILGAVAAGSVLEVAIETADTLLDRFTLGPLVERLTEIAPNVVARELPVLVHVDGGERNGSGAGGTKGVDAGVETPKPVSSTEEGAVNGPVSFLSGSVDLLYRDPATGLPVVADYKTDRVEQDDEIAERTRLYAPQARAYARAIQEALDLPEPPRAELWFLWPGRVEPVDPPPADGSRPL